MENKNKNTDQNDQEISDVITRKRSPLEGRPTQFGSFKTVCSIRIPEHLKIKLKQQYGSIQKWIDGHIKKELEG